MDTEKFIKLYIDTNFKLLAELFFSLIYIYDYNKNKYIKKPLITSNYNQELEKTKKNEYILFFYIHIKDKFTEFKHLEHKDKINKINELILKDEDELIKIINNNEHFNLA